MPNDSYRTNGLHGTAITALADPQMNRAERESLYIDFIRGLKISTLDLQHAAVLGDAMALASFGKEDWIGDQCTDTDMLTENCYHIHFACALDLLKPIKRNGEFSIGFALHYETNPSIPQIEREGLPGYLTYLRRRNLVKKMVHQQLDHTDILNSNLTVKKRHSKNAMLTMTFHRVKTFTDLQLLLEHSFQMVEPIVDRALAHAKSSHGNPF